MEKLDKIKREVAIIAHNYDKQHARVLMLGGHLSLAKVHQYDEAMCEFDDLPFSHRYNYLVYAGDIVKLVEDHIETATV